MEKEPKINAELLLKNIRDYAVFIIDSKGFIKSWNEGAQRIKGYEREEVLGKHISIFYTPEGINKKEPFSNIENARRDNRYETESLRIRKDGTSFWARVTFTAIRNNKDEITGYLKITRDITETKEAEEKLMQSNIFLNSFLENIPNMVFVKNAPDLKFILMNKAGEELLGLSRHDILGKSDYDFFTKEQADFFTDKDKEVLLNGTLLDIKEEVIQTKEGLKVLHTKKIPITINGYPQFLLGISEDITEWKLNDLKIKEVNMELEQLVKKKNDALLFNEQQYKYTLDNMLEGIQIVSFDWRYIYVNDALVKHSNKTREQLIGRTMMEQYPGIENTPLFKVLSDCMNNRLHKNFENRFVFEDGEVKWFDLSVRPAPEGIFILTVDITSRKLAESKIKELNQSLEEKVIERTGQLEAANKELDSFTYSVSHDLRAPLRALSGYSQILEEDYGKILDEEAKRLLNNIHYNAQKMGVLIDDLLAFSRLGRKEMQKSEINMSNLVTTIVNELTQGNLSRVNIKINQMPSIKGDYTLMSQVWTNLISNALKYTSKREIVEIEIGSQKNESSVTYFVKDNGVGFDMNFLNKLFGVFQRLHSSDEFEGTGVGLAIVQRIINKHGGRVWAEGKENIGATFYFELNLPS